MEENYFQRKIIFLFFFAKQRKMRKSFSMKMIFTPTKHILNAACQYVECGPTLFACLGLLAILIYCHPYPTFAFVFVSNRALYTIHNLWHNSHPYISIGHMHAYKHFHGEHILMHAENHLHSLHIITFKPYSKLN